MFKCLVPAALALTVLSGTLASAKAPVHTPSSGLTTLKSEYSGPQDGSQWQDAAEAQSSFTSVTVIQDGLQTYGVESAPLAGPGAIEGSSPPKRPDGTHRALAVAHLPEPSTWILLILGLGTIGFALRGLVAANRRLARLAVAEEA